MSRGSQVLWQGAELRDAEHAGLTLDELDLHAGDEVEIPERQAIGLEEIRGSAFVFGTIITLTQIF